MIIYSRFNCKHFVLEENPSPLIHTDDVRRAKRRMNNLRFNEQWLQERVRLFETYTLPSVLSQTSQKFRWIGIVHPDTSPWFIRKLKEYPKLELRQAELDIEAKEPGCHTTINLDTDDALSKDFIAEARKIDFQGETIFPRGMRYREFTNCWITTRSNRSHFNLVQHPEKTVLDFSHGMGMLKQNIVDLKRPLWLEIIHEQNISNSLRTAKASKNMGPMFASQYFDVDYNRIKNIGEIKND